MRYQREIRVGLLAVATIFAFVWGYNFLKGNDIFSKQRIFYTVFTDVAGLTTSAPVLANGYKVGLVRKIYFEPKRQRDLVVEIMVTSDQFRIPKGTKAELVSDILGTTTIMLVLGNEEGFFAEGDTLEAEIRESLLSSMDPIKKKAEQVMTNIDSLILDIRDALGAGKRESSINRALSDLAATMENLKVATGRIDGFLADDGDLKKILGDIEGFTTVLDNNKGEIDRLVKNLATFSDSLAAADITATIDNANRTLSELALAIDRINNGEGSIGKLLKDDSLYNNLNSASAHLDSLFIDIKARPKRYVHFSLFGKKEKN